jgi:hypothetical protein
MSLPPLNLTRFRTPDTQNTLVCCADRIAASIPFPFAILQAEYGTS